MRWQQTQPTGLERLSVLVVDDSRSMRELLSVLLFGLGVGSIASAKDGFDALHELSHGKPDIVFVDWSMEGMDGLAFIHAVRSDARSPFRHVPIVMITGYAERERVTAARDAGVNEFLAKPISGKALAARIENLIHRPRPFIRTATYYGPDRRRKAETYEGPERRAPVATATRADTGPAEDLEFFPAETMEKP